jgi:hypothetical protein
MFGWWIGCPAENKILIFVWKFLLHSTPTPSLVPFPQELIISLSLTVETFPFH